MGLEGTGGLMVFPALLMVAQGLECRHKQASESPLSFWILQIVLPVEKGVKKNFKRTEKTRHF